MKALVGIYLGIMALVWTYITVIILNGINVLPYAVLIIIAIWILYAAFIFIPTIMKVFYYKD